MRLTILSPESLSGRTHDFDQPEVLIGRARTAGLRLAQGDVSRSHAVIRRVPGRGEVVEDLGSRTGTLVNGEPVHAPRRLRPGDILKVGAVELRYERPGRLARLGPVRMWRTASAAVISAGAVAGAVVSLVSFWPDPDPADIARFTSLQITTYRMPLSEYSQRATTQAVPDAGGRSGPAVAVPLRRADAVAGETARLAWSILQREGLVREAASPGTVLALASVVGQDGGPVDPVVAANRIVEILKDSCRRVADGQGGSKLSEPLGVVVRADVELQGMRDKTVALSWSMWEREGGGRLHGDWLNDNLAYRLRPSTDHDTTSLDLWVPLPQETGPYVIRTTLRVDGVSVASSETSPFD